MRNAHSLSFTGRSKWIVGRLFVKLNKYTILRWLNFVCPNYDNKSPGGHIFPTHLEYILCINAGSSEPLFRSLFFFGPVWLFIFSGVFRDKNYDRPQLRLKHRMLLAMALAMAMAVRNIFVINHFSLRNSRHFFSLRWYFVGAAAENFQPSECQLAHTVLCNVLDNNVAGEPHRHRNNSSTPQLTRNALYNTSGKWDYERDAHRFCGICSCDLHR